MKIVLHRGEKGVIDKWGKWLHAPTIQDYKGAVLADKQRKEAAEVRVSELR